MTTTATYIIKAVVGGETYLFQYEHCYDAWTALEQFWHEDYADTLAMLPDSETFPIDILSMLEGKVIDTMPATFNCAIFDHFFDKGWNASSPLPDKRYTIDQFAKDIERWDKGTQKNIIDMWSDWCMDYDDENLWLDYMVKHPKGHCNRQHMQEKWDYCYEKYGNKAAMTMFWRGLDHTNRNILTEYITTQWRKN